MGGEGHRGARSSDRSRFLDGARQDALVSPMHSIEDTDGDDSPRRRSLVDILESQISAHG
jgi:hypothetical protein